MAKSTVGSTNKGVKLSGRERSGASGSGSDKPKTSKLSGDGDIDNFEDISKPPAGVTLTIGSDSELRSLKSDIFNNPNISDDEVFAAFGALSGSSVDISSSRSGRYSVSISAPYLSGTQNRSVVKYSNGDIIMSNSYFRVAPDYQGTGIGTKSFARQVEFASKLGVNKISTFAAKSTVYNTDGSLNKDRSYNGYYTWARLGYDASPTTRLTRAQNYFGKSDIRSIADLFDIKASSSKISGADWWKNNGESYDMTFDLTPGSRSRKRLTDYSKNYFSREGKNTKLL